MSENLLSQAVLQDAPIDITAESNFIWSIANMLKCWVEPLEFKYYLILIFFYKYRSDKYKVCSLNCWIG